VLIVTDDNMTLPLMLDGQPVEIESILNSATQIGDERESAHAKGISPRVGSNLPCVTTPYG
jgi:hypothetical protein